LDSHDLTAIDRLFEEVRRLRDDLGFKLYGYCLMRNHIHLIVEQGSDTQTVHELMERLSDVAGRTTLPTKSCPRPSPSLQGRFRGRPIDSDRYLLTCMQYVELNPIDHRKIRHPEDYQSKLVRECAMCGCAGPDGC
jgi:putative transposase